MEPNTIVATRQGTGLGGQQVKMRFDENSLAHLMSVLTDLYSDPELAVIREYSTNAFDSHVEAGISRPIEVSTPTTLSPYFKVKDYGIGMSVDDVEKIYSAYGASTKRDTNEQVGMLGLGCKSALTYTNQFTVIAIKNGVKTSVAVSRVEDGTGVMEVLDTCATDEPNGVEVTIPTAKGYSIEPKARDFFRFWKPGTVLLNGSEPSQIQGEKIGDHSIIVDHLGKDFVVMGNVAYPIDDSAYRVGNTYRPWNATWGVVSFVEIGDINFTPSREALHYTARTKETLSVLRADFSRHVKANVQADIDESENHTEALKRYLSWQDKFQNVTQGMTYKGAAFETRWNAEAHWYHKNYSRHQVRFNRHIEWATMNRPDTILITGYPGGNVTTTHRAKIREWSYANSIGGSVFVLFTGDKPGMPWTTDVKSYPWEVIRKTKLSKSDGLVHKSTAGSFDVFDESKGYFAESDSIDTSTEIVYFSPADTKDFSNGQWQSLADAWDDLTLVSIGKNRWDKFVRDYPTAKTLYTFLRSKVDSVAKNLTETDRILLGIEYDDKSVLSALAKEQVDDPAIIKFIDALDVKTTPTMERYSAVKSLANRFGVRVEDFAKVESPLTKYPLIRYSRTNNVKHMALYVNAVYAAEKE